MSATVEIKVGDRLGGQSGVKSVPATMVGEYFAITPSVFSFTFPTTVTHVPTGYSVTEALGRREARRAIRELLKLPIDWSMKDPEAFREAAIPHRDAFIGIKARAKGLNSGSVGA